jgi:hypothetical protein
VIPTGESPSSDGAAREGAEALQADWRVDGCQPTGGPLLRSLPESPHLGYTVAGVCGPHAVRRGKGDGGRGPARTGVLSSRARGRHEIPRIQECIGFFAKRE